MGLFGNSYREIMVTFVNGGAYSAHVTKGEFNSITNWYERKLTTPFYLTDKKGETRTILVDDVVSIVSL